MKLFVESLEEKTQANSGLFIIWMIIAGVSLFLTVLVFIPLSVIVNRSREEVLGLFLDIKEKKIKSLYSKCENFINNLQIGEEDDVDSIDDLDKANEDDPLDSKIRKRKRKFKNSSMNFKKICLALLLGRTEKHNKSLIFSSPLTQAHSPSKHTSSSTTLSRTSCSTPTHNSC